MECGYLKKRKGWGRSLQCEKERGEKEQDLVELVVVEELRWLVLRSVKIERPGEQQFSSAREEKKKNKPSINRERFRMALI